MPFLNNYISAIWTNKPNNNTETQRRLIFIVQNPIKIIHGTNWKRILIEVRTHVISHFIMNIGIIDGIDMFNKKSPILMNFREILARVIHRIIPIIFWSEWLWIVGGRWLTVGRWYSIVVSRQSMLDSQLAIVYSWSLIGKNWKKRHFRKVFENLRKRHFRFYGRSGTFVMKLKTELSSINKHHIK